MQRDAIGRRPCLSITTPGGKVESRLLRLRNHRRGRPNMSSVFSQQVSNVRKTGTDTLPSQRHKEVVNPLELHDSEDGRRIAGQRKRGCAPPLMTSTATTSTDPDTCSPSGRGPCSKRVLCELLRERWNKRRNQSHVIGGQYMQSSKKAALRGMNVFAAAASCAPVAGEAQYTLLPISLTAFTAGV
jgi:hypothetical protein